MDFDTITPQDRLTLQLSYQWVFEAVAEADDRISGDEIDVQSKLYMLAAEAPDALSREMLREVADPSEEYLQGAEADGRDWHAGLAAVRDALARVADETTSLEFRKTLAGFASSVAAVSAEDDDEPVAAMEPLLVEIAEALGLTREQYLALGEDGRILDFIERIDEERQFPHEVLEALDAGVERHAGSTGLLLFASEEEDSASFLVRLQPSPSAAPMELKPNTMVFVPLAPGVESTIDVSRASDPDDYEPISVSITANEGELIRAILAIHPGVDETAVLTFLDGEPS
jgi:hypothetical protein